jgi:hypothetical protein
LVFNSVCAITGHQGLGEHRAHHLLFGRGEHVDDPVDRLGGRARVQRAEHEVARLGGRQRQADGLEVAHFADQDVVRVLAQRAAQRVGERQRVRSQLALVDQALLRLVHELDRVLDRQDVPVLVVLTWSTIAASVVDLPEPVGPVHRMSPRGRFAISAKTFGALSSSSESTFEGMVRNAAAAPRDWTNALNAEAGEVRDREAEVALEVLLIHLALRVAHDVVHHGVDVLVLHRRQVDPAHVAVDPDHRRQARRHMQVGRLVLDSEGQKFR